MNKIIYQHRIIEGSKQQMRSQLQHYETSEAIIDGALCTITLYDVNPSYCIRNGENTTDPSKTIYQIKVYGDESGQAALIKREFLQMLPMQDWKYDND